MKWKLLALRGISVLALAACGALLADYLIYGSGFCGARGGCREVISSAYGRPLGVPLPAVGLAGFGLFLGLTLFPQRRSFALVAPLAGLAGVAGLGLILLQILVLRQTCWLCLIVDGLALGLAAVAVGNLPSQPLMVGLSRGHCLGWVAVAALAATAPPVWAWLHSNHPVPDLVKDQWVAGKVNVVVMMDFDCPHCHQADLVLRVFRREHGEGVHFARLVAPLPSHRQSRTAGRAYLAALAQGPEQGEAMAAALVDAPGRDAEQCRLLAGSRALDLAAYDKAVSDPALDAQLDAPLAWVKAHDEGLPLIWVQDRLIRGVPTVEQLQAAVRRAQPAPARPQ
jgi:uncharacterized membrane protein